MAQTYLQLPLQQWGFDNGVPAMEFWQWIPLSVAQLKGKHCRKPHCCYGVADMFRHAHFRMMLNYDIFLEEVGPNLNSSHARFFMLF